MDMQEVQGTKNGKITRFPCNPRLQQCLRLQHLTGCDHNEFVFPGLMGGRFDSQLLDEALAPLVTSLRDRGDVAFYLPQDHFHHGSVASRDGCR